MRKSDYEIILEDFEDWKKETDKMIDLKVLLIGIKPKMFPKRRKEIIEDLYVIKEGEETILSAGVMIWLYLGNSNKEEYTPTKKELRNPRNVLEEMKIRHRLKLFNIKVEDLDRDNIRESVK